MPRPGVQDAVYRYRVRIRLTAALLGLIAVGVGTTQARPPGLETSLTAALRAPDLSLGHTAAIAVDTTTGRVLYAHNATTPVVPASNEKLPVAWAALSRLGPSYRFSTKVLGDGTRVGATWRGNLVLVGGGDPTLTSAAMSSLAATIHARGIRRVTGSILGDESAFDAIRDAPGWKRGFLGIESPPLSALIVDRALGWPAHSPPWLAAIAFRQALQRAGITVSGKAGLGRTSLESAVLAETRSARLADIVREMNRESDNFVAEMLLKQLATTTGETGSTVGGARVVLEEMRAARIPTDGVRIVDGSGLSALDRLTAVALVGVLRVGLEDPMIRSAFIGSLAVAGTNGTLRDRLPALRGLVVGKTGTTNLACTLSGLLRRSIAFAVLQNGRPVAYWSARAAQDRFVNALASGAPVTS